MDACSIKFDIQEAVSKEALATGLFKRDNQPVKLDLNFVTIPETGMKLKVTNKGKVREKQYSKEELDAEQESLKTRSQELEELLNCK